MTTRAKAVSKPARMSSGSVASQISSTQITASTRVDQSKVVYMNAPLCAGLSSLRKTGWAAALHSALLQPDSLRAPMKSADSRLIHLASWSGSDNFSGLETVSKRPGGAVNLRGELLTSGIGTTETEEMAKPIIDDELWTL
ncbi:hypothetical protein, partial [Burkholderia vietnamiensis]|uniref:hypothetical protein n=1 Tax=Burkholderia vietnamiensis TaxID=60552 RepID=UPI001CF3163B